MDEAKTAGARARADAGRCPPSGDPPSSSRVRHSTSLRAAGIDFPRRQSRLPIRDGVPIMLPEEARSLED